MPKKSKKKSSIKEFRKSLKKKKEIHKKLSKKYKTTSKKCSKGKILRRGYIRRSKKGKKIEVPPTCVKDTGKPGRTLDSKKIPVLLDKNFLGKFGYKDVKYMSTQDRRAALKKAAKKEKSLSIYRRLILFATLSKAKDKKFAKIVRADAEWLKKNIGL